MFCPICHESNQHHPDCPLDYIDHDKDVELYEEEQDRKYDEWKDERGIR